MAVHVITSVLIVACPCALALSAPFAFGSTMRIFGRKGFFLKKAGVVESLARVDTLIFDKTGTLTRNDSWLVEPELLENNHEQYSWLRSLARQSTHPLSQALARHLSAFPLVEVEDVDEIPGLGILGRVSGHRIRLGSWAFAGQGSTSPKTAGTRVFASIDERPLGAFRFSNTFREGLTEVFSLLRGKYQLFLLSGDHPSEQAFLSTLFPEPDHLIFEQTPADKLKKVEDLRAKGHRILMAGDGLNDAGALRASDCGISIADDVYHFSPACDAILASDQFSRLASLLAFSRKSLQVVRASLVLSLVYNIVGLGFALAGKLTPVISAILMPLSSVSVVVFVSASIALLAKRRGLW